MDFGKRLLKLRNHFGYLQKDLGKKLNRTASAYGKKERTAEPPSQHHIDQLAAIYGLSPGELISECELELYIDEAGEPAVKARKKEPSVGLSLLRVVFLAVAEFIERKEK